MLCSDHLFRSEYGVFAWETVRVESLFETTSLLSYHTIKSLMFPVFTARLENK
jgi:hypothetical protein